MLKNITLSADEELIRQARARARRNHTTLNAEFRVWLERFGRREEAGVSYAELMDRIGYASPGRRFTREDLNARR